MHVDTLSDGQMRSVSTEHRPRFQIPVRGCPSADSHHHHLRLLWCEDRLPAGTFDGCRVLCWRQRRRRLRER